MAFLYLSSNDGIRNKWVFSSRFINCGCLLINKEISSESVGVKFFGDRFQYVLSPRNVKSEYRTGKVRYEKSLAVYLQIYLPPVCRIDNFTIPGFHASILEEMITPM